MSQRGNKSTCCLHCIVISEALKHVSFVLSGMLWDSFSYQVRICRPWESSTKGTLGQWSPDKRYPIMKSAEVKLESVANFVDPLYFYLSFRQVNLKKSFHTQAFILDENLGK